MRLRSRLGGKAGIWMVFLVACSQSLLGQNEEVLRKLQEFEERLKRLEEAGQQEKAEKAGGESAAQDETTAQVEELRAEGATYEEQLVARQEYRTAGAGIPRLYYAGYVARDGGIVIGCLTRRTRDAARRALGMEHEQTDGVAFDPTDPANLERSDAWREEIVATIRQRTVTEWMAIFAEEGVPASPVNLPEELADDPQVEAMGIMVEFEHDVTGTQRVVGPIVRMSETPTAAQGPSPALGLHTREVLREHGLSDAEVDQLRADGVIGGT